MAADGNHAEPAAPTTDGAGAGAIVLPSDPVPSPPTAVKPADVAVVVDAAADAATPRAHLHGAGVGVTSPPSAPAAAASRVAEIPTVAAGSNRGGGGWLCCHRRGGGEGDKASKVAREYDATEHLPPLAELPALFPHSGIDVSNPSKSSGLSSAKAAELLSRLGPNRLTPPRETPEIVKFFAGFLDLFLVLLQIAGWLCILASGLQSWDRTNLILGLVIFAIVILTVIMNYVQARQTASVMAGFRNMAPDKCYVLRDGRLREIDPASLVVGDIVQLKIGKNAPADCRVIATTDLKADLSSLTGESEPIRLQIEHAHDLAVEAKNIVFSSAALVEGEGFGVVIRTGDTSMIGNIASLASDTTQQLTTMERDIRRFVHFVSGLALVTAIVFFIIGAVRTPNNLINVFVNAFIVVLVANVPEGLPATVTSCLTITAKRMGERSVFIKKMDIVETLGAATVICSDKTGTLTQNKMAVMQLWYNRTPFDAGRARGRGSSIAFGAGAGIGLGGGALAGAAGATIGRMMAAINQRTLSGHGTVGRRAGAGGVGLGLDGGALNPAVLDPSYAMSIGRRAAYDGEGRLRVERAPSMRFTAGSASSPESATAGGGIHRATSFYGSFSSFGNFMESALPSASWKRSNPYMRLIIAAGVCNRAFRKNAEADVPPPLALPSGAGAGAGAGTGLAPAAGEAAVAVDGGFEGMKRQSSAARRTSGAPMSPAQAAAVMARAAIVPTIAEEAKLEGDASDQALYRFVDSVVPIEVLRAVFVKVWEIPFNSTNKWSYAVTRDPENPGTHVGLMKGAPEIILTRCSHYLYNGEERPIDDDFRADHTAAYERFGFMGQRVLGLAYRSYPAVSEAEYRVNEAAAPKTDLVFAGLVALMDPPKEGVDTAIQACHQASIKVTMVTGDHPLTAEAIARKVNIITGRTAREVAAEDGVDEDTIALSDPRVEAVVFSGTEIRDKLKTPGDWDEILSKQEVVFARTTPQQKLIIVSNYQRRGEIVAVTGDGVNDSPALKRADIGVAMGIGGSAVAKAAGDILLMDDNFASIVNAIEEGRVLFDNLKKSIAYTLAHLWPELLPVFLNVAFSFPLALPGLLILTIDLISEQGPAISFAYEKAEGSVMLRPPRDQKTEKLVSWPLITYTYLIAGGAEMIVAMFAFFAVYLYRGIPISRLAFSAERHFKADAEPLEINGVVFDPAQQLAIYYESVAAWYATIVACQFWHVWTTKTRLTSLARHGIFSNFVTIIGTALAVVIMLGVVYIPWLQDIFQTGPLSGVIWPINLIFLLYIVIYSETYKAVARRWPSGWVARKLAW